MPYTRVIPRDLFNEAKLLKCLGQFALIAHDGVDANRTAFPRCITIGHDGEPFVIDLDEDNGELYCRTFPVTVGPYGYRLHLSCPYNSRSPFPLMASFEDYERVAVFNDDGTFSDEFVKFVAGVENVACCGEKR